MGGGVFRALRWRTVTKSESVTTIGGGAHDFHVNSGWNISSRHWQDVARVFLSRW